MRFGFVGLGQMGAPMAINLAHEHDVLVYDQNASAIAKVERCGAKRADKLDQFSDVDVLITCLPAAKIVDSALFDSNIGLAQHLKPSTVVVDTSTIEYGATLEIRDRLQTCLLYTSPSPRDRTRSRMPSSA